MKNKGMILLLLAVVLLVCPVAAMGGGKADTPTELTESTADEAAAADNDNNDTILVFSPSSKKVTKIDLYEYVVGAVAAEMPPTYHSQALRAQAVACYTYALKARENGGDESLNGADIIYRTLLVKICQCDLSCFFIQFNWCDGGWNLLN